MSSIGVLLLLSVASVSYSTENVQGPVVQAEAGTIIGTFHDLTVFGEKLKVERYFGIPYAEPPLGDLRFRKPIPKQPLKSPYKAVKHGDACYQMDIVPGFTKGLTFSEDCLFLNLYVPANKTEYLPVMIWIHGGGFVAGASDAYVSDALAAFGSVIVVTLNYRLSLWGFLSTGDGHAPGNNGLFDQHLAIRWVHDNVKAFGGDTSRITIFGESAGAASVVYQSTFEGNGGLFQRAIAQSGDALNFWAFVENVKPRAEKIASLVGCTDMESGGLIRCIKGVSGDTLGAVLNNVSNGFMNFPFDFVPNVDGEFLKKQPKYLTKVDQGVTPFFGTVDFLTGINTAEGAAVMGAFTGLSDPEAFKPNRTYFEGEIVQKALSFVLGNSIPQVIQDLIVHEYTEWEDTENMEKIRSNIMRLYREIVFSVGMLETTGYHSRVSKHSKRTYLYQFDVTPSHHLLPTPSWVVKANHADELEYLFFDDVAGIMTKMSLKENYVPEEWEKEVAQYMITMWSNFAKTG